MFQHQNAMHHAKTYSLQIRFFRYIFSLALVLFSATVFAAADIQVTSYVDTPDPVGATQTVTYSMVVDNNGDLVADNVHALATVPSGMSFVSATSSAGTCAYSAPNVDCSVGSVAASGAGPVSINVVMRVTAAGGSTLTSTASVTTSSVETNTGNNSISQGTTVSNGADLALAVTASPDPVNGSGIITYTLQGTNLGPNGAQNSKIVNTLPPGVTYISAAGTGWSCSQVGQVVTCDRTGTDAVGNYPPLTIEGRVTGAGSGTISNIATISSSTPDGLPNNNTPTTNTTVNPGADLSVIKTVTTNPVLVGAPVIFALNTANNGPSAADTTTVTDTLPAGFTNISASGGGWTCNVVSQTVTCTRPSYAAGASSLINITATAPSTLTNPIGDASSNTAGIDAATTYDGNAGNDNSTVNFTIYPTQADLSLTKNKTPNPVAFGSNMTSTIVVTNDGPLTATSPIRMTDILTAGEVFVSASGTDWTCAHAGGIVTCSYSGSLTDGQAAPAVTIITNASATGTLTNTACTGSSAFGGATHPEGDSNTANDCKDTNSTSTSQIADLTITKTLPVAADNPLLSTDNSLTYRLTIINNGPDTSTNVVVTDNIPVYTSLAGGTGLTFTSGAGNLGSPAGTCSNSGGAVTCNYAQLKNGESAVIDVIVTRPILDGAFTNTAIVNSTSIGDSDRTNNSASVSHIVNSVADVELTSKTVTPSSVKAGVETDYLIQIKNNGPSEAQSVVLSDTFAIPVGDTGFTVMAISATLDAVTATCTGLTVGTSYSSGSPSVSCTFPKLAANEVQGLVVRIRPNFMASPPSPRTLSNTASVTTTTRESDGPAGAVNPNNSKTATLTILAADLDMLINKTDAAPYGPDPIGYDASDTTKNVFSYRIRLTNQGPSYATGVVFTDVITTPSGKRLTFLGDTAIPGTPAAGICSGPSGAFTSTTGTTFTCTVPTGIAAGGNYERILYFRAEDTPAVTGDNFVDVATVTTNEPDNNLDNNHASDNTTLRLRADVEVSSKTASPNPVNLTQPFNWTIVVKNNGPADASDPRLTDNLPANMVLTGTPNSTAGTCTGAAGETGFTCDFGVLAVNATATVTVPVKITSFAASYDNTASISTQGKEIDTVSTNNSKTGSVGMVKSSIAGVVYRDLDDSGTKSGAGETGISGVQMRLTGTDAYDNLINVTVTTDINGIYLFDNLTPSNGVGYTITEVAQPAGYSDGKEKDGSVGGGNITVNEKISNIALGSNKAETEYLFGEIPYATVSGHVYNDINGLLGDNLVNGTGTNAGSGSLTAYLVQGGNVVASSAVSAGGTFSFSAPPGSDYTVVLANTASIVANGQPAPSPSLPAGWVNTGENNAASTVTGSDGTINGVSAPFSLSTIGDVIDRNFGIEQPPVAGVLTYPGQPNPGGTTTIPVDVGAFVGVKPGGTTGTNATDTDAVTSIRITAMPNNLTSITINGVKYGSCSGCTTFPTGGVTITVAQLANMAIDPVDGAVTVVIPYVAIDAAGKESGAGSVTLPIGQLTIAGNVFSDNNGSKIKDGSETSSPITGLGLNAVLTDQNGKVLQVVPLDVNGNYVFANLGNGNPVQPNTTYIVTITTANPAIDSTNVPVTLPSGWVTTGENLNGVVEVTPNSRQTVTVATSNVVGVNFGMAQTAGLSGIAWRDNDHDRAYTVGEPLVQGIIVEVVDAANNIVGTTTTDINGAYTVNGLTPGVDYKVRFRDAVTGGVYLGLPTNNHNIPNKTINDSITDTNGATSRIDNEAAQLKVKLVSGNNLINQSLPLDPSGVVYDAITRLPVPGAVVTLIDGSNNPVSPSCLMGGVNTHTTGPLGIYQYLLITPAPVGCQGSGVYTLQVVQPSNYIAPPSSIIPPTAGNHVPVGVPGGVQAIQAQAIPPTGVEPTIYYLGFNLTVTFAGVGVVNNHIPLDPITKDSLIITKTGNKSEAEIGDTILYTVKAKMLNGLALSKLDFVDNLPAGFRYVTGTATQATGSNAATTLSDPAGSPGPKLTFKPTFASSVTDMTITYKVRVGVGAMQGDGVNRVRAFGPGPLVSNVAQFKVKVTGGVFTNEACLAGKVFVDCNNNHIQDSEELGIPGVRLYMEDGTYFITDVEGKYSYCGISPKTHVLKPDRLTLPRGSRLTITSNRNAGDANSLFLDVKNGELIRGDFAEGSCSNTVLEQVKARRSQGEVRAPETDKKGEPALKFEGKSSNYPQQGTDSANQRIVKPREGGGAETVSQPIQDIPVTLMPEASANTRGNQIRDRKFESQGGVR